jgi:putative tryptophan/tyrosine transport system substrate-binding protein
MRRRDFVRLAGGTAAAWPILARAQQQAMPVIGFISSASLETWAPFLAAFQEGLGEAGYVERRNIAVEYRWAEDQYDRLPALAVDLVRHQVAVIVAAGTPATLATARSRRRVDRMRTATSEFRTLPTRRDVRLESVMRSRT